MQRVRTFFRLALRFSLCQQQGHARQRAVLLALYVSLICWLQQTQAAAQSPGYAQQQLLSPQLDAALPTARQQRLASMPQPVLLFSIARVFANTGRCWHLNKEAL